MKGLNEEAHAPGEMARASAIMYAAGSTVVLLVVAGPWVDAASRLSWLAVPGFAAAAGMHVAGPRAEPWMHHIVAVAGIAFVTCAVVLAPGPSAAAFTMIYAWIAVFVFAFFSLRAAAGYVGLAALAGGAALLAADPAGAPVVFIVLLATVTICGGLSGWLVRKVRRLAQTDPLTGLPNRRAWEQALRREGSRAARDGTPVALAALDLDLFKAVNDQEGHAAGDDLLRSVSDAWSSELRASDLLARCGGDEFALVLPSTPSSAAAKLVQRLRGGLPAGQTCSAGVAIWDGVEPLEEALIRADRALYRAKRAGRDRVVMDLGPAGPGALAAGGG